MADLPWSQVEALLNEFFIPGTSNDRKREIETYLEQYGQASGAFRVFLGYVASTTNPYVSMFCLTSLERIVNRKWAALEGQERMEVRIGIQSALEQMHAVGPPFVRNKLIKILVDIARLSWPQEYPEFLSQIIQLLETTPVLGLLFVLTTSEELGNPRGNLTVARKAELRKLLLADFPRIFVALIGILHGVLERHKRPVTPPPSPVNNASVSSPSPSRSTPSFQSFLGDEYKPRFDDREKEVLTLTLACIGNVFSWAPLTLASSCGDPKLFLDAVFRCAAADIDGAVGEAALGVLAEIVGRNWVPVECHDFLGAVFKDTFRLLRFVIVNGGDKLKNVSDGFIDRLTEYLRIFISLHIRRLESPHSADQTSMDEFLRLMITYSFTQASTEKFLATLDVWAVFLDYLKAENEAAVRRPRISGVAPVGRHTEMLGTLTERILHKIQFRHNQVELEELDDGKLDEDGETEWRKFLRECIEMLARIGELAPDFAVTFVLQPLDDALKVYLQLESTVINENGIRKLGCSAENECRKLHCLLRDLASFLQAAGRFGDFFVNTEFRSRFNAGLAVFSKLCETTAAGSRAKFYSVQLAVPALRDDFVEVMAQSMAALKPWSHWFALAYSELIRKDAIHGDPRPIPFSQRQWDDLLRVMLRTVVHSLVPEAPEKICLAAAQLLCTMTKVIRPAHLLETEEMKSLAERVPRMTLPRNAELLLYRSIANAVMLTWPGAGGGIGDSVRQEHLNAFIRSLTSELLSLGKVGMQGPSAFAVIEKTLVILTSLVENVEDETTATKAMLCRSIQPHLAIACTLLAPCVMGSSSTAEAILDFFFKTFQVLRTALGVEAAGKIVEAILSAFAAAGVMESCFRDTQQASRLRLVERLLAVLALDSGGRPGANDAFVAPTLDLCLDQIHPRIKACPDLAAPLFEVLTKTLSNNWRFFFEKATGGGGGDLIAGKEEIFQRLMQVIGSTFMEPDLHVFRQNLAALEELNGRWKLYSKPAFRGNMLWSFERVLLDALLKGNYDLLQEEILNGIFGLAETDFGNFFMAFLPACVDSIPDLKPETKEALVRSFAQQTDSLSFKQNLLSFVNDVRCHTSANA